MVVSIEDHRDAAPTATEAGRLLVELRGRGLRPAELRAEGDARSQQFSAAALASRHAPGSPICLCAGLTSPTQFLLR